MHHTGERFDFRILILLLFFNKDFGHVLCVSSDVVLGVARLLEGWVRLKRLKLQESRTALPANLVPTKGLNVEILHLIIRVFRIVGASLRGELFSQGLNLSYAHFTYCSHVLLGLDIAPIRLMIAELIHCYVLHVHRVCGELHALLWAVLRSQG